MMTRNEKVEKVLELIGLDWNDLSDVNLSDADLSGTNLRYANLSGTNLSHADLSDADLSYANLIDADTRSARKTIRRVIQKGGGIILYRTKTSEHVGNTVYEKGRTYVAPSFSLCPNTPCHPGIYGNTLDQIKKIYPTGEVVKIYVRAGEWHFVSEEKGFRAKRVRVVA